MRLFVCWLACFIACVCFLSLLVCLLICVFLSLIVCVSSFFLEAMHVHTVITFRDYQFGNVVDELACFSEYSFASWLPMFTCFFVVVSVFLCWFIYVFVCLLFYLFICVCLRVSVLVFVCCVLVCFCVWLLLTAFVFIVFFVCLCAWLFD